MRISDWSSDVCSSDLSDSGLSAGVIAPDSGVVVILGLLKESPATRLIPPPGSECEKSEVSGMARATPLRAIRLRRRIPRPRRHSRRSEEHTSELQSLMRISYAVFCLKNKIYSITQIIHQQY